MDTCLRRYDGSRLRENDWQRLGFSVMEGCQLGVYVPVIWIPALPAGMTRNGK